MNSSIIMTMFDLNDSTKPDSYGMNGNWKPVTKKVKAVSAVVNMNWFDTYQIRVTSPKLWDVAKKLISKAYELFDYNGNNQEITLIMIMYFEDNRCQLSP